MLFCVSQTRATAATVDTDQIDYQPNTTAIITGSGFVPGETVELQVLNLTTPSDIGAEHDPWTTNADVNGAPFTSALVVHGSCSAPMSDGVVRLSTCNSTVSPGTKPEPV